MLEGILIVVELIILDKLVGQYTYDSVDKEILEELKIIK